MATESSPVCLPSDCLRVGYLGLHCFGCVGPSASVLLLLPLPPLLLFLFLPLPLLLPPPLYPPAPSFPLSLPNSIYPLRHFEIQVRVISFSRLSLRLNDLVHLSRVVVLIPSPPPTSYEEKISTYCKVE